MATKTLDETSIRERNSNALSRVERLSAELDEAMVLAPMQARRELLDVLSDAERESDKQAAQKLRELRRRQEFRTTRAEIRAQGRAARAAMRRDAAERRLTRISTPEYRRLQAYQRSVWSSRVLIALVCIALGWAAVNVQRNLAPYSTWTDPLWWFSFGAEAIVSGFVVALMLVSTTATSVRMELDRKRAVTFEALLMTVTLAMNSGPHVVAQDWGTAAKFSVAPAMIGIGMALHGWISSRYSEILAKADADLENSDAPAAQIRIHPELEGVEVESDAEQGSEDLDLRHLAETIVAESAPTAARTSSDEYDRIIDTVESILAAYEDGGEPADISHAFNVSEADVWRLIGRAGELANGAANTKVAAA
ncbi:hypothetical protein [Nocardia neocaledoniensis]|uniref:hypothetical protein n=1 Tax=Nocardia neocaledoniensis TaxID=236511 RepID=UPI0024548B8C|nr:hypothetical protein [Nocardia neocaledoniensis]